MKTPTGMPAQLANLLGIEADGDEGVLAIKDFEFGAHGAELFGGVGLFGGLLDLATEFAHFWDEFFLGLGLLGGNFGEAGGMVRVDRLCAIEAALQIFDGGGCGILAEGEFGAGGVEDADGFIGELAAGDVAVGEADGGAAGVGLEESEIEGVEFNVFRRGR